MKKIKFVLTLLIFSCLGLLFCGCSKENIIKNNKNNYTIEFTSNMGNDPRFIKYKIYIKGKKWRQDHFRGNSDKPYLAGLFDGKNFYMIYHMDSKPYGVKKPYDNLDDLNSRNLAYPFFNWDKPGHGPYLLFEGTPEEKGKIKTQNGFDCTMYEYKPINDCKSEAMCIISTRKVCVGNDNVAVSILVDNKTANGEQNFNSVWKLDMVNIDKSRIKNSIFKKPEYIFTEEEMEKNPNPDI